MLAYPLNALYKAIGISKQAVHQYAQRQSLLEEKVYETVLLADEIRLSHPGCGVEKLYYMIQPDFIGRDRFIEIFMDLGYRLKKRKNYRKTTISSRIYAYENLIEGQVISAPYQIWQTDITYFAVGGSFCYGVFIKDIYTKEITGYHISNSLRVEANVKALKMAFRRHTPPKIHHSDRGSQYTSKVYSLYDNLLPKI